MRFVKEDDQSFKGDLFLPRRSLYVMRDAARYLYTHEILKDEDSYFDKTKINKGRRISVICRNSPTSWRMVFCPVSMQSVYLFLFVKCFRQRSFYFPWYPNRDHIAWNFDFPISFFAQQATTTGWLKKRFLTGSILTFAQLRMTNVANICDAVLSLFQRKTLGNKKQSNSPPCLHITASIPSIVHDAFTGRLLLRLKPWMRNRSPLLQRRRRLHRRWSRRNLRQGSSHFAKSLPW